MVLTTSQDCQRVLRLRLRLCVWPGGRWDGQGRRLQNDPEQAPSGVWVSLLRLHPAGLYPVVVGVKGRGAKDSPSWFVLVSFNTFLAVSLHRGGSAWV